MRGSHTIYAGHGNLVSPSAVWWSTANDYISKMATSVAQPAAFDNRGAVGGYKDFQTVSLDREAELKGTDKFAAASFPHYLPVWDNENGVK